MSKNQQVLREYLRNSTSDRRVQFNDSAGGGRGRRAAPGADSDEDELDGSRIYKKGDDICGEHMIGKERVTIVVPRFTAYAVFLKRGVMIYGASGTGKSVLMRHIMNELHSIYPMCVVWSPTNINNHDYDGVVPPQFIYDDIIVDDILKVYNRQVIAADMYSKVNDVTVLELLFRRCANELEAYKYSRICEIYDARMNRATMLERTAISERAKVDKARYMKPVIHNARRLLAGEPLSEAERYVLEFLYFNPNIMVIFDDGMTEIISAIKEGKKRNNETIKNFFFKGRHVHITHFYLFQDDKELDTGIRKNAYASIFTSKSVALAFFSRPGNNFTKEEITQARAAIATVFSDEYSSKHYKLIYLRDEKDSAKRFQYICAEQSADFRMCYDIVWNYCDSTAGNGNNTGVSDNPCYRLFHNRAKTLSKGK